MARWGNIFESFTLFFSVLFGSVIVDYVRGNAHKTGKMIPGFDMTLKTPYDIVNRRFEEQYNFVKFYGPMWIVFNDWLLLLSCYIEVVLLVYVALKWANRRFETGQKFG